MTLTARTKLSAEGVELPADATDHAMLRIEHPLLAQPLVVTAEFAPEGMTHADARRWAESLTIGGFAWRLPTLHEAMFIPDHSRYPSFDPALFRGARNSYPWIWTGTPYAEDPSGVAWLVGLGDGYCSRLHVAVRSHVLAVRAGQPLDLGS